MIKIDLQVSTTNIYSYTTTATATTNSSEVPLVKVIVDVVYDLPNYSNMTQTRQDLIAEDVKDMCIESGIKEETIKEIIITETGNGRRRDSDSVNVRIIFEDRLTTENVATIVEEVKESTLTVNDEVYEVMDIQSQNDVVVVEGIDTATAASSSSTPSISLSLNLILLL
eukprot:Awhi_evm1s4584